MSGASQGIMTAKPLASRRMSSLISTFCSRYGVSFAPSMGLWKGSRDSAPVEQPSCLRFIVSNWAYGLSFLRRLPPSSWSGTILPFCARRFKLTLVQVASSFFPPATATVQQFTYFGQMRAEGELACGRKHAREMGGSESKHEDPANWCSVQKEKKLRRPKSRKSKNMVIIHSQIPFQALFMPAARVV